MGEKYISKQYTCESRILCPVPAYVNALKELLCPLDLSEDCVESAEANWVSSLNNSHFGQL